MPIITNFGHYRFVGSKEEFRKVILEQHPNIPPDHLKHLPLDRLNILFKLHKPRFFKGE
tara:strand:- start:245 stop:421 length:177 start_codon:yes stop_codon:yes gene_type:complete